MKRGFGMLWRSHFDYALRTNVVWQRQMTPGQRPNVVPNGGRTRRFVLFAGRASTVCYAGWAGCPLAGRGWTSATLRKPDAEYLTACAGSRSRDPPSSRRKCESARLGHSGLRPIAADIRRFDRENEGERIACSPFGDSSRRPVASRHADCHLLPMHRQCGGRAAHVGSRPLPLSGPNTRDFTGTSVASLLLRRACDKSQRALIELTRRAIKRTEHAAKLHECVIE